MACTGFRGLIVERLDSAMERTDYFVERSNRDVGLIYMERNDYGTKWPDNIV